MISIESERLVLREWRDDDRRPFAEMSADTEVMAFLLPLPTSALSNAWIDRQIANAAASGFCFWAVETSDTGEFVGAIGLNQVKYDAPFTPAVEVGWRVARPFWGRGFAPEAAAASLRFGFEQAGLAEIVANAGVDNIKSRRVMTKLGMTHDPADDFDHPRVPEGNPLRRQVLYRISRDAWRGETSPLG